MICEYCKKEIESLPFKCSFCSQKFCKDHRLPEKHDCESLKQYHQRKSSTFFEEVVTGKKPRFQSQTVNYKEKPIKDQNKVDYVNAKALRKLREQEKAGFFQKIKLWFRKFR